MRKRTNAKSIAALALALALLLPLGAMSFAAEPASHEPVPAEVYAKDVKNPSVFDAAITIAGVTYPLPLPYKSLLKNGWKLTDVNIINPDTTTLNKNEFMSGFSLASGEELIEVSIANLTEDEIKICDGTVVAISVTPEDCVFDIAGITGDITAKAIVEKLGRPASIYDFSFDGSHDYEYVGVGGQEYQLKFRFEEDGKLRSAYLRNFYAQPAYAPTGVAEALRAAYQKPSALGRKANTPIFELNGALYQFPCPLGEFIDNGWKIAYVEHGGSELIESGRFCSAQLANGDYLIAVQIKNTGTAPAAFSDCVVDTLSKYCSPNAYSILRLSGGIEPGITTDEFEKLLGADATKPLTLQSGWGGYKELINYNVFSPKNSSNYYFYFDPETKALAGVAFNAD